MLGPIENESRTAFEFFRPQTFAVGVWHNGVEEYHTFGRVSPRTPHTDTDTTFPIASVSKSFIATALWMLIEEGRIDIDAPVIRYLPEFEMYTDELTRNLIVRDAMCHCYGMPRHDFCLDMRADFTLEQTVHIIRHLPPAWPPHTRFGYSNHMYSLVTLLVQRVSGMPWGDFVQQRIFQPLHMHRSCTQSLAYRDIDDNHARPRQLKNGVNRPVIYPGVDAGGCSGAITCSIRDLLQWSRVHLYEGELPDGDRLFSRETARQLHGLQTLIRPGEHPRYIPREVSEMHYGMGWFIERYRGETLISHGGAVYGYKSIAGFIPGKDFAFAILANSSGSYVCEALGRKLCDIRLDQDGTDWNRMYEENTALLAKDAKCTREYMLEAPDTVPDTGGLAGRYENKGYGVFDIRVRNGRLTARVPGVDSMKTMPIYPSRHYEWVMDAEYTDSPLPLKFELLDGRAVRMLLHADPDLAQPIVFDRNP